MVWACVPGLSSPGVLEQKFLAFRTSQVRIILHGVVSFFLLFYYLFYFIYFIFGCVGSSLLHAGFSLVAASGGYSLLWCVGFSLWWLLLLGARALGIWASVVVAHGLSSCGSRAVERRLSSCGTQA